MQAKLLEKVVSDVAGKAASEIVNILFGKKNVNEFLIAKKLSLTINQTRNILYKLSDEGLVSFIRKKDKKKGWYTYFWTLDVEKALIYLQKSIKKELEQLSNQLENREEKNFFICKTCGIEVNEETALLNNFICKECGQVYELHDDEKIRKDIETRISNLNEDLKIVEEELTKIRDKKEKAMQRREAAEKREKAAKRKKAREKRRKAKKEDSKSKSKSKTKKKSKPKKTKTKKKSKSKAKKKKKSKSKKSKSKTKKKSKKKKK